MMTYCHMEIWIKHEGFHAIKCILIYPLHVGDHIAPTTVLTPYSPGYLCTLFRRRRLFPNIRHPNPQLRAYSERQAVNFCVQGENAWGLHYITQVNLITKVNIMWTTCQEWDWGIGEVIILRPSYVMYWKTFRSNSVISIAWNYKFACLLKWRGNGSHKFD